MFRSRLKTILFLFTIAVTLVIIAPALALWSFSEELDDKLEAKKILKTTEILAPQLLFFQGEIWSPEDFSARLQKAGYRERKIDQALLSGDFVYYQDKALWLIQANESQRYEILYQDHQLKRIVDTQSQKESAFLALGEKVIAQYVDKQPIMQKNLLLGEIPSQCLKAVIAIEDSQFLEHGGVSYTGILRAVVKNTIAGKKAQGGSTITQQLVKNYFLTPEKTLSRKLREILLSVNLETKFTKDQILETYLNIIYMGQNGSFQIHGFGAAAENYFGKEANELQLHECALLAAIINNPGLNNPWQKPEPALKRRKLVLTKMLEIKAITESEMAQAEAQPLPRRPVALPSETAPYFIDAALKQLRQEGIAPEGKRVLLSIDLEKQSLAQKVVQENLSQLEDARPKLKKFKAAGLRLEGSLLSTHAKSGLIVAAVGGRSFRTSQFNRITEAQRQVGSLVKPFIYLTAFQQGKIKPDQLMENKKFTIEYDRQKWTPENYEKDESEAIPAYVALKNSVNIPAARLTLDVGVKSLVDVLHQFGLEKNIPLLPSISLGAFEQTPLTMLSAYSTLSQMGQRTRLSFVIKASESDGREIYHFNPQTQLIFGQSEVALLISMMKQTNLSGTAKGIGASGFPPPSAGKTGTTNDYKDAWYVGFTPQTTTLVWVGYDQNQSHGLTGASSSVPIWLSYMKNSESHSPLEDWSWPANTELKNFPSQDGRSEIQLLVPKQ